MPTTPDPSPVYLTGEDHAAAIDLRDRIAALPDHPQCAPAHQQLAAALAALTGLAWQPDCWVQIDCCSRCGGWTFEDALAATYARTGYLADDSPGPTPKPASEPTGERLCDGCLYPAA